MTRKSNAILRGWLDEDFKWTLKEEAAKNKMSLLEYQRKLTKMIKQKNNTEEESPRGFEFRI